MNIRKTFFTFLFLTVAVGGWGPAVLAQPIEPQLELGVDRPGSDYRNFDLNSASPASCRSACENDGNCRAWTYVKPGVQGSKARCWLKTIPPTPQANGCCTSGFINALHEIQACREIGNIVGSGPVVCIDPGGRNFGKAGKTFKQGDKVMILARFRRLQPGTKEISAVYSKWSGGQFVNFSGNKKTFKFKPGQENWAFWFPASHTKTGRWRVSLAVKGAGLTGQVLGRVEYCVNCALD